MPVKLYNEKYRIDSARRKDVDYSMAGAYFITINTQDRFPFFGKITNGNMNLSELGKTVQSEWLKTADLRKSMNVSLGECVVMPDHFHAVLFIGTNSFNSNYRIAEPTLDSLKVLSEEISTEIPDIFIHNFKTNAFGPQSNNLASIIRGFKSSVTTFARKNQITFNWQSSFHCRVIQSINDLEKINLYIENNIKNHKKKK
jgi:putative transposase